MCTDLKPHHGRVEVLPGLEVAELTQVTLRNLKQEPIWKYNAGEESGVLTVWSSSPAPL